MLVFLVAFCTLAWMICRWLDWRLHADESVFRLVESFLTACCGDSMIDDSGGPRAYHQGGWRTGLPVRSVVPKSILKMIDMQ